MTALPSSPTIADYQSLIAELVVRRGFHQETISEVFTLFIEEVGELAKAIREFNGQKIDANSLKHEVAEEAADVLWLLIDLCNRLHIDLEQAFRDKEVKNQQREWK